MARASKQSPPSQKRPPSRLRDRARHEAEVLQAAERLFAARGYEATTIAEVAQESGFSVATLYNLFGSKDAILDRLLVEHFDAFSREIEAAVAAASDPRAKLHASVIARARYCETHREFFTLVAETYLSLQACGGDEPAPKVRAVEGELARLERIFRTLPHARLDAATRALAFYGATRAYIVERVLGAERAARPAELAKLVDALLDGLA